MTQEEMSPDFARRVGERLRDIRRQQGLSLQAVEQKTSREFKASVLGAYERGERIISVLRLQRLASIYAVPVDQLLPRGETPGIEAIGGEPQPLVAQVTVDLAKLESSQSPERDLIRRYVSMIQIERGDFNGRMITIRGEDVRALGRIFDRNEQQMRARFQELGICR